MNDYYTVGIIFDAMSPKQYTYKVSNGVHLNIGDYVAVGAPGLKVVQVKAIHEEPKDTEGYDYKFIAGLVTILPQPVEAPKPDAPSRL